MLGWNTRGMMLFYLVLNLLAQVRCSAVYKGADFSSLIQQEKYGTKYYNVRGQQQPLEVILADNGVNAARLRLFVNSPRDKLQLAETIALARRSKARGMKIYLDMHLSDVWADPLHQNTPRSWNVKSLADLSAKLQRYTRFVGNEFAIAGVIPEIVSIGNEINSGILFPWGRVPNYDALSMLLKSAIIGFRQSRSKSAKVLLHIANKGEIRRVVGFLDAILAPARRDPARHLQLSDFQMVGHSIYPYYSVFDSFRNLEAIFRTISIKFGKQQIVAETNWPINCPSKWNAHDFPPDMKGIWFDEKGQFDYLRRIGSMPFSAGFFVWEPAWLARPHQGSPCPDLLMFDSRGHARTSVSVFKAV